MTKLRKFWHLSSNEQWVLCLAAFFLVAVEVGLRIFSFRNVVAWTRRNRRRNCNAGSASPERIAWLVETAARHSGLRPTCLRKSIVFCALLEKQGLKARLVIGTTSPSDAFRAHAWVEVDGKVLGAEGRPSYVELVAFENLRSWQQMA
ncbi:MAG: lasso peptide biosynthesis B2 protein [Acidobacteria bacterium]|nr:lasso peptide biosynthesis B2 protein [Acidobacteriota bacterium]